MRTELTRTTLFARIALIGALHLSMVSTGFGQTTTLPLSTIEAASTNASQQSEIASYASYWSERALGADRQQAARAEAKLVEPLVNSRVSISFRRAYSDSLGSYLDQLKANGDIGSTLMALRLAGELGTTRASQLILSSLESNDAGVRIFAAGRAGRAFRTTAANGPAMSANDLTALIAKLELIAGSAPDRELVSACVQSLGQGCSLPSKDFLEARARCMRAMCNASSAQLIAQGSDLESRVRLAMLASGAATNSLLQVGEESNKDAVKAAVALGANMISIALSEVISGTIPPVDSRELYVTMVRSGESLLYFALRENAELNRRPVGNVQQTTLADQLQAGQDRSFRDKAALLLGAGSPIVKEFGFADDQFVH